VTRHCASGSVCGCYAPPGLPIRHRSARAILLDISNLSTEPEFSPAAGQMILNLLLLGADALPSGGTIILSGAANREVLLRVAGPNAAWPPTLARYLLDPNSCWNDLDEASKLQAALTALLAAESGYRLSLLLPMTTSTDTPAPILLSLGAG